MTRTRTLVIALVGLIAFGVAGLILILVLTRPAPAESGTIQVVSGPLEGTGPAPVLGAPVPTPGPDEPLVTLVPLPLESTDEASAKAGFPAAEPSILPDGYFLAVRQAVLQPDGSTAIQTMYQDGTGAAVFLILTQVRFVDSSPDPHSLVTPGESPLVDVVVAGLPAVWAERAASSITPGNWQITGANTLLWQQGGFTFILQSNVLPLDTLRSVGESLPQD